MNPLSQLDHFPLYQFPLTIVPPAGTEDRSGRLSLRRTCSVLRSSLSRSSFGASSNSLARSNSSGSESRSRVVMRSVVNRGLEEERRTVHLSSFSSRDSLDCNVTLQERSARSSTSDEGTRPRADDFCLRQLRAQLAMQSKILHPHIDIFDYNDNDSHF